MFLSVPCKTSNDVDIKKPILNFIERNYGSSARESSQAAIDKLNATRKAVVQKLRDKTPTVAQLIAAYHDTLFSLESRVPMNEKDARIDFKWSDFTGKSKKLCSIAYERANLIFCYGAINSQLAATCASKEDAALKQALAQFKVASSAFNFLATNNSMFGILSSSDITVDTLKAYSCVMIAQAQECFFLKAEQVAAPGVVAKLGSKLVESFDDAVKRCSAPSLKNLISKEWVSSLTAKRRVYTSMTEYYQSKDCETDGKYGERIARLKKAYEVMKQVPSSVTVALARGDMLERIKREQELAEKDNNFIYHAPVPAIDALSPIPGSGAINPPDFKIPISGDSVEDAFPSLIPFAVLEAKNQAIAMRKYLIAAEVQRLREGTDTLNSVMTQRNLPAAIQINAPGEVDGGLLEMAAKIRYTGGASRLLEQVQSLPESAGRNRDIITQQLNTLDQEEQNDNALRAQYGESWSRQPSSKLTSSWRSKIEKLKKFLDEVTSKRVDQILFERFREKQSDFDLLSQSDQVITEALQGEAGSKPGVPSGKEGAREELAYVCSEIDTLKADRSSLSDQLTELGASEYPVQPLLRLNTESGISEEQIRELVNSDLEVTRSTVRASLDKQEELLAELEVRCEAYFGQTRDAAAPCLATRLRASAEAYFLLEKDVKEGMSFYAEVTQSCLKEQEDIDNFCMARSTEKEELIADLTATMNRMAVSNNPMPASVPTTTNAPPPRPLPTYPSVAPSAPGAPSEAYPAHPPIGPSGQPMGAWPSGYNYPMPQYPPYGMPMYPTVGAPMYGFYPGFGQQVPQMNPYPGMPGAPPPPGAYPNYQQMPPNPPPS